jgi:hypothetical protein
MTYFVYPLVLDLLFKSMAYLLYLLRATLLFQYSLAQASIEQSQICIFAVSTFHSI